MTLSSPLVSFSWSPNKLLGLCSEILRIMSGLSTSCDTRALVVTTLRTCPTVSLIPQIRPIVTTLDVRALSGSTMIPVQPLVTKPCFLAV